ncbi:hypothetical protein K438DRAFT_1962585 [Mycena galopus ATCC 62051]|nr:hypothetical protein K438DRAFT_1962585 [Mycena galopus ATCC 62051]
MSTTHNKRLQKLKAPDESSNFPSSGPSSPLSPFITTNFPHSTLNFVNVTEEEARDGLNSVRTDKNHGADNTSEQRAAHNAVERQRREKLTQRIFDLESLLGVVNAGQHSTRTAIVSSAITYLHAARRHRTLAAQELRILRQEADSLRREANEWRSHAGVAFLNEPARSEAFEAVLHDLGPNTHHMAEDDEAKPKFMDRTVVLMETRSILSTLCTSMTPPRHAPFHIGDSKRTQKIWLHDWRATSPAPDSTLWFPRAKIPLRVGRTILRLPWLIIIPIRRPSTIGPNHSASTIRTDIFHK